MAPWSLRGLKRTRSSNVEAYTAQRSWMARVNDGFINILLMTSNISKRFLVFILLSTNSRFKFQMSRWPRVNDICL